jgi:hypothetical protein
MPAMADGPLARLFWRVVDAFDYWLMQARLGIVDAVCGPEPETVADQMREADRERLREAFPRTLPEGRNRR